MVKLYGSYFTTKLKKLVNSSSVIGKEQIGAKADSYTLNLCQTLSQIAETYSMSSAGKLSVAFTSFKSAFNSISPAIL